MKLQSWPEPDSCYVDDPGSLDPYLVGMGCFGDPDAWQGKEDSRFLILMSKEYQ